MKTAPSDALPLGLRGYGARGCRPRETARRGVVVR
jgi:hypothetical protein